MEIRNMFSRIFGKQKEPSQNLTQMRMLNGYSNEYTPFNGVAYDNATVRSCVDTIARHASKLNPRHIVKKEGKVMRVLDDRLNYLLSVRPNPLMTSAEFIEKLVNQYFTTNNMFVYVQRDLAADVVALWPLDFTQVSLYEDSRNVIYVKFTFGIGMQTTVPYDDIIHIRRHFNRDEMFGDPEAKMLQEDLTLFSWHSVVDTDLAQYEIRMGSSWDAGTVIAKTKALSALYQVTANGTYTFWIAAMNAAGVYSASPARLSQMINIVPNAVTNLRVTQSSQDHSKAVISFTKSAGEDIAYYAIRYGNAWAAGTEIIETKENKTEWQVPASGTYNIMVQVVTVAGQVSAIANASITITIEPLDVTGFRAQQSGSNKTLVLLSWNPITDPDIAYYVIKQGTTWETGTVIAPRVSGVTYEVVIDDEQVYSWMVKAVTIAGNESQYPAVVSEIFGLEPSPVTTIQLRQNPNDRSQLNIQWAEVLDGDLVGYQVKIGSDWNSAEELPLTNELYATYTLEASDTYHVMIKTKNSAGYYSDEASANITCKVEPTNATNFVAYQNGEEVELYWTKSVDTDVVGYEIREGSSFRNGSLVATSITNNYLVTKVDIERLYQYHIVAINRAGFISDDPKTTRVLVENLPIKNVILTFDEIARQSGTHSNTEFGESQINFQTVGGRFSDYPTTRWTDLGGAEVLKLKKNASTGLYPASGVYTLQRIDVGSIITADISVYFVSTVMYTGGVSAILQFRTSLDAVNWIDWMEFRPVQRRFRYIEFKVLLATDNTAKTPEVNHLAISIDVPDTDIAITYAIASGGTTVPYGHTFYTIPNVTASAIGDMLHAVVVSKTKTNCVIKVKNQSNADTSGTVDLKIKGY